MTSTLRESEEHDQGYGSSKIKVTILASEWGSSKGGLSTINRELAIQLAKFPDVEITFFLPKCSEQDKKEALGHKINIVEAKRRPGFEELEWLSFPPEHLQIDVIVGHGVKLGRQAQVIRESHRCRWVQVVHTDPEELGMFKSYPNPISKGERKHQIEVELCEMADFVVGVGSKVTEAFRSYLRGCQKDQAVLDLTPSVFDEFLSVQQVPEERMHCRILVFGRGDVEDFALKGYDIAAKAVASLPDTHLVFVGAPIGKQEEIANRLLECGISASRLKVRGYVESRERLKHLFCEVDMVLMPSRTEGFGLTGLEALSAGLPVLISKNSGFGEALSEVRFGSSFVIDSEDPKVWAAAIDNIWDEDRQRRLEKAEALRTSYEKKYSWAKQSKDLLDKIINLIHAPGVKLHQDCSKTDHTVKQVEQEIKLQRTVKPDIASCEADIAFFAARHDADTRQWLFEDFDNWFSDPGDSRAYVLLGDAGVGKSVMAGVLAQRTRKAGHLGAAYFCRHNDGTRNDPRYLLGTVACQLCDCDSQYSNIVGGEGGVRMMLAIPKLGVQELFTKLLEEPLVKCNPCQQRKLVIIDALDETEYESREDFLDLMKERFPRLPKWLVFFITSRPEDTIQSRLERYNPCVRICAGNSEQHHFYKQHEQDIRQYLKKRIDFSSVPYSVEDITNKCDGLFLYAFYIQKELGVPAHSGKIDQLSDRFPGDIDDFFRENFQRMYDKVGADLYKKLIGCVIAAPSPLPVSFISFVLNKEKSDLGEQEVIDAVLHFSLYQTSDDSVTFLHKLIPTWLTKNQVESKNQRKTKRKRKDCPHLLIDRKAAGEYLRTLFVEFLPAVVGNRSPEFPSADVDLQDYVLRFVVRFLCQLGDIDALKDVFSCLTSYHFLEKRIQNGRTEIYHLLEDFKLAVGCSTFQDTEKLNILQEISLALERNVHVLLECPHLLHSCLLDESNAVQGSILIRENVVIPQVSGPCLEWNVCDLPSIECLSGFNVFATASDKKTVAAANGRSLLFFDACTLKIVAGPFELNQGDIEEISHLEFSPNDKFVFFGRLDKWFSVEKECVEVLSEFSKSSIIYEWGLFTPDGRHILVKNNDFFQIPHSCRVKGCIVELLALWAVKEMDKSRDDERTCCFNSLWMLSGEIKSIKGGPTERLLERFQCERLHVTCDTSIPYDPTCCYCCRFKELKDSNEGPSLAAVRQLIIELYPHIFQYQVWNFKTGRPLLQDAFHTGIQLNLFTYFCHVSGAFDEWGKDVGCSGIEKVVSVCNTAVVNAVYALWKLTLFLHLNQLQESNLGWIEMVEWEVTEWRKQYLKQVQKRREEGKEVPMQKVELQQMRTRELLQELKEVRDFERLNELENELRTELGQLWTLKPLYLAVQKRKAALGLELELEKKRWRISAPTWLFRDPLKSDICGDFPKGFQDLFGVDASLCVSPRNKWVAEGGKDSQEIDLFQTTRHEEQLEHKIVHVERFTFTNDDLYVVYLSSKGSLHALSLQTGTLFTSVSGPNLLHFTRERQFGYLFRSGSEEKTIFLTNLFRPFKFLSVLPIKTSVVSKSIAAIFTSSDTVMSISSDLTVALWNTSNETKGFAFKFISGSALTNPCSHVLHDKNCVLSPNGKLVACHQETKIEVHSLAESGTFHDTVIEADSGITNVCLTFSADSSLLLCYIQDSFNRQHFYVWDVQKTAISASFKSPGLLTVECFCISWDNRNLILCGEYEIEIWEYNQRPCRLLRRIIVEEPYQSVKFCQCAVSSDNELLFCCVANIIILFSLRVPDVHSSKRILRGHLGRIEFCKFLKVSRYLISYGVDGMVFLWDLIKTKAVGFVRVAQGQENIVTTAVSPEESRVVCFTSSGRVCEIKLCKLEEAPSWKLLKSRIKSKVNNTSETVREKLGKGMALTSKNPVQYVEDESRSSSDSEQDMDNYYLEHDDVDEFD